MIEVHRTHACHAFIGWSGTRFICAGDLEKTHPPGEIRATENGTHLAKKAISLERMQPLSIQFGVPGGMAAPSLPKPFMEVEMVTKQTRSGARSRADQTTHPFLEMLGDRAAQAEIFLYSVKMVCGKQTETNCCCVGGVRPGVYATEVNIQNLSLVETKIGKAVLPLINSGAVIAREPNVSDLATLRGRTTEVVTLPPLGATMDDCCRIAELLPPPSGDTSLTIAILTILSFVELAVSAVYTANPLGGDGISIDVEYIPSHRLGRGGPD